MSEELLWTVSLPPTAFGAKGPEGFADCSTSMETSVCSAKRPKKKGDSRRSGLVGEKENGTKGVRFTARTFLLHLEHFLRHCDALDWFAVNIATIYTRHEFINLIDLAYLYMGNVKSSSIKISFVVVIQQNLLQGAQNRTHKMSTIVFLEGERSPLVKCRKVTEISECPSCYLSGGDVRGLVVFLTIRITLIHRDPDPRVGEVYSGLQFVMARPVLFRQSIPRCRR